ncbi:TetR/AcrR family transcriptional regulator [Hansschlegelia sp. KR7-227]|jgi:AcrR family transcriptional regulator|uniref:TetR/AcrR family transcriptional regulator n=1 Tax=Hansschlegelia sp. KR7-227 TaxID=3400914 RepID=UPI003C034855
MVNEPQKIEGLRQRKRRETLRRIADRALDLFIADGYEATTLDAVAAAAGISRRTFFYYFKSKEEILLAWQNGFGELFREAILREGANGPPIDVVRDALTKLISRYTTDEMIAIDRLMRSHPTLMARKQAKYVEQEGAVFEALCALWPDPNRRVGLRLVAMASLGALRLAIEAWSAQGSVRAPACYLEEAFAALKTEI